MSVGEHSGHALSVVSLVVGGMFAKSAVLNWIVGPAIVVVTVSATTALEHRLKQRMRKP